MCSSEEYFGEDGRICIDLSMDFSKLRYNISKVPLNEKVIDHFSQLSDYSEFKDDQLLRICILATDENSPFVKSEREDYEKRLTKIFEYLKITDKKLITSLVSGVNKDYELMVSRYFMLCDNLSYVMWESQLRMFHGINQVLRAPIDTKKAVEDTKKRAELTKSLKEVHSTLLDYESQIFSDIPTRVKLRQQVAKLIQPAEMYSQPKGVI